MCEQILDPWFVREQILDPWFVCEQILDLCFVCEQVFVVSQQPHLSPVIPEVRSGRIEGLCQAGPFGVAAVCPSCGEQLRSSSEEKQPLSAQPGHLPAPFSCPSEGLQPLGDAFLRDTKPQHTTNTSKHLASF